MDALGCERHELGVFTTARGLVCADLSTETICLDEHGDFIADLSGHPDGLALSETLTSIHTLQSSAACILIVEKDTVFQALIRAHNFFEYVPCILVTARGYPDTITIRFLQRIRQLVGGSGFPIYYLGDLDPHGVSIFLTYNRSLSGDVKWIGLHFSDIELHFHQLLGIKMKACDYALLNNLIASPEIPQYVKAELCRIEKRGLKYEVECMHAIGETHLAIEWLPNKILSMIHSENNLL
jgi:meiotic recombination protein SPO11